MQRRQFAPHGGNDSFTLVGASKKNQRRDHIPIKRLPLPTLSLHTTSRRQSIAAGILKCVAAILVTLFSFGIAIILVHGPPAPSGDWIRASPTQKRYPHALTPSERRLPEEVLDWSNLVTLGNQSVDTQALVSVLPTPSAVLRIIVVPFSFLPTNGVHAFDSGFQRRAVGILTTMISYLMQNPIATFVWSEMAYFAWWWDEQDVALQQAVRRLVSSRRLEFVTGAWVALRVDASESIDTISWNIQEGHDWIRTHVGAQFVPRVARLVGSPTLPLHRATALLLKRFNFTSLILQSSQFNRVNTPLTQRRAYEFFWRPVTMNAAMTIDPINGQDIQEYDIFTHVMPLTGHTIRDSCGPNPDVCCQFDFITVVGNSTCTGQNQTAHDITIDNVEEQAHLLLDQYRQKATLIRSHAVWIPLGGTFRFQSKREAAAQFTNYQAIMDCLNHNVTGVHMQFGTLSDYVRAARQSFVGPVPIVAGDLHVPMEPSPGRNSPDDPFDTSHWDRPFNRQLERSLWAAESMESSSTAGNGRRVELQRPRRALLLRRHVQGVYGSSSDPVTEPYVDRMMNAIAYTNHWILQVGHNASLLNEPIPQSNGTESTLALISSCNDESANAILYNPLAREQAFQQSTVKGRRFARASAAPRGANSNRKTFAFDPVTGRMLEPIREEWFTKRGENTDGTSDAAWSAVRVNHTIERGGFVVSNAAWKRTVLERDGSTIDFLFETVQPSSESWFVRFSGPIQNNGFVHTESNGRDVFDTTRFMAPNNVFRMALLASIQDDYNRMTVLAEEPQQVSFWKDGSIDVSFARAFIPYEFPATVSDDDAPLASNFLDKTPNNTVTHWHASSKLRVLLEEKPSEANVGGFQITAHCQRVWDELRHPVETLLKPTGCSNLRTFVAETSLYIARLASFAELVLSGAYRVKSRPVYFDDVLSNITLESHTFDNATVPFIYMVYQRVDYLQNAMVSLRNSDFPRDRVPIVISHDGRVPEMVSYVRSLQSDFPHLIQWFHPFACYDHPYSFPGNDTTLNVGYKGDKYGHPRSFAITCCKHHFTWLVKTVFTTETFAGRNIDTFLFLEEDYVVSPIIYQALVHGLNGMDQYTNETDGGFLGLYLDPTDGGLQSPPDYYYPDDWFIQSFRSGPVTLHRSTFDKLQDNAAHYCGLDGFDEYNWDWSFMSLQTQSRIPHTVLTPARPLARHIGIQGGMHRHKTKRGSSRVEWEAPNGLGGIRGSFLKYPPSSNTTRGSGGWGHPADQQHCMRVLAWGNETME